MKNKKKMSFDEAFVELKSIAKGKYCILEYRRSKDLQGTAAVAECRAYIDGRSYTSWRHSFREALDEIQLIPLKLQECDVQL
jgi:hypothetical protein